jgi:hypothetical protein
MNRRKLWMLCVSGALLAAILFFATWLFLRAWLAILFYGYLAIAAGVAVAWISAGLIRKWRFGTTVAFVKASADAMAAGSWIKRLWWRMNDVVLLSLILGMTWPVFLYGMFALGREVRRRKLKGFDPTRFNAVVTNETLFNDLEPASAATALLQILLCYVLVWLNGARSWYEAAFFIVIVCGVMLRHLGYAVSPGGLPSKLRSVPGSPHRKFAAILIGDFLTLVLGLAAFGAHIGNAPVSWAQIYALGIKLATFDSVRSAVWAGGVQGTIKKLSSMPPSDLLTLLAGALFSLVLARAVLRFKEFSRTDEDHISVAFRLSSHGRYKEALKQLAKVRDVSSKCELCRIPPNVALGNHDRAFASARRAVESIANTDRPAPEDVYMMAVECSISIWIPTQELIGLILAARPAGVCDAAVTLACGAIVNKTQVSADDLLSALSPETRAAYPLTYGFLLTLKHAWAEALEIIEPLEPAHPADELTRLHLLLIGKALSTGEAQRQDAGRPDLDEWFEGVIEKYLSLCEARSEPWYLLLALEQLLILKLTTKEHPAYERVLAAIGALEERLETSSFGEQKVQLFRAMHASA